MEIFTEDDLALHKEYLHNLSLKYSILRKSVPIPDGIDTENIQKCRIDREAKDEAYRLLFEIRLHENFFSCISENEFERSALLQRHFGSEAVFCNNLYKECLSRAFGFVFVGIYNGAPTIAFSGVDYSRRYNFVPVLSIDLCEHAFYGIFKYKKEEYLKAIIPRLRFSLLDRGEKV